MLKATNIFEKLGMANTSDISTAALAASKIVFLPIATMMDKKATDDQKHYTIFRDVLTETFAVGAYLGITKLVKDKGTPVICKKYLEQKAKLIEKGKLEGVTFANEAEKTDAVKTFKEADMKKIGDYIDGKVKNNDYYEAGKKAFNKLSDVIKKISPAGEAKGNIFKPRAGITNIEKLFRGTQKTISLLTVSILAVSVIPGMCNVVITPLMKSFNKRRGDGPNPAQRPAQNPVIPPHNPMDNHLTRSPYANRAVFANMNMRVG